MSLIKFPTHIPPARVTIQLRRVDEVLTSPLTNIQQVASRGNPAWMWTYEFTDLSLDEREIVQAFLMKCKGSLNTFKVQDPGNYSIRGTMSDWTDHYGDHGYVFTEPGSDGTNINSWFRSLGGLVPHINEDGSVAFDIRADASGTLLRYRGDNESGAYVDLPAGQIYAMQIKHFAKDYAQNFFFNVQSNTSVSDRSNLISSEGVFTLPFYTGEDPSNHYVSVYKIHPPSRCGDQFTFADWRLVRAALVVNTENMLTYSNAFNLWTASAISVESGFIDDPLGGDNWWRLSVNSDDGSTNHYLSGSVTIPASADVHTIDLYMKFGAGLDKWMLQIGDTTHYARAYFDLSVGSAYSTTRTQSAGFQFAKIFSGGNGSYRVQLTSKITSDSSQLFRLFAVNSDESLIFAPTTSCYVDIFNAGWRRGPVIGASHITTDTAYVGSADNFTGSRVRLSGFDPETVIKAGTRFELINQYHDDANDLYERSEFKRVTQEVRVGMEGHAMVEFDPPIRNEPKPFYQAYQSAYSQIKTTLPVAIFHRPEMKARLLNGTIQYIEKPLQLTDIVFDVMEDLAE